MLVRVQYHFEGDLWWAESPDVDGFYAGGDSYEETREHAEHAIPWALDRDDVALEHVLPVGAPSRPLT